MVGTTEIGLRLRLARTIAGMTQNDLGLAVGLDDSSARQMIGQYEAGQIPSAWLTLWQISAQLALTVDGLLARDTAKEIGDALFAARKAAGLSQAALGAAVGYQGTAARQAIGKIERGAVPRAWLRLKSVTTTLDVSADYLLGEGPRGQLPRPARG